MLDEIHVENAPDAARVRKTFLGCGGCVWAAAGLFFFLLVVALCLPAVSSCREAARRVQCRNNLTNIMVAMNSYSAKYGCYPPAYTVDKQGRRMHSWRTLLLEFSDRDLYAKYNLNQPWNSPGNLAVADMMKRRGPYRCPSEQGEIPTDTNYVMLVGPQAFSDGPHGRKQEEITDGLANTIAVVEMAPSGIHWTEPRDLDVSEMSFKINDPDSAGIRSSHAGGAFVLFADGSVQYLTVHSEAEKFLKELSTIDGKEDLSKFPRD